MRTALVADWLVTYGGAEHVLAELLTLYPGSPLFTTVARHGQLGKLDASDIRTSRLQPWYRLLRQHQLLLPAMPRAMEDLDLRGFDLIISSSHAVAKGIIPPSTAQHICYCHTPMRYAWEMEEQYLDDFRVPRFLRPLIKRKLRMLRRWDLTTAQRVDAFIANSSATQERIRRIYNRESVIIPPPVDDRFFERATHNEQPATPYFLAIGRFVPYKRFDLLIAAANVLALPLRIAGSGQDEARLRRMAGATVRFLGRIEDRDLPQLFANAQAVLFPQEEDAGIVLLESLASGTPVIAYKAGGALDAVEHGVNGILFDEQSVAGIINGIHRFRKHTWNREMIREGARRFSQTTFHAAMRTFVAERMQPHMKHIP